MALVPFAKDMLAFILHCFRKFRQFTSFGKFSAIFFILEISKSRKNTKVAESLKLIGDFLLNWTETILVKAVNK